MTAEETTMIQGGFKNLNEKMDLVIAPVKESVSELKAEQTVHTNKIGVLELFKEGHQTFHLSEKDHCDYKIKTKRFYWEILAGFAGVILAIIVGK